MNAAKKDPEKTKEELINFVRNYSRWSERRRKNLVSAIDALSADTGNKKDAEKVKDEEKAILEFMLINLDYYNRLKKEDQIKLLAFAILATDSERYIDGDLRPINFLLGPDCFWPATINGYAILSSGLFFDLDLCLGLPILAPAAIAILALIPLLMIPSLIYEHWYQAPIREEKNRLVKDLLTNMGGMEEDVANTFIGSYAVTGLSWQEQALMVTLSVVAVAAIVAIALTPPGIAALAVVGASMIVCGGLYGLLFLSAHTQMTQRDAKRTEGIKALQATVMSGSQGKESAVVLQAD